MKTLDGMAASGKQQRVNTPLFGWDLVSSITTLCIQDLPIDVTDAILIIGLPRLVRSWQQERSQC